MRQEELDALVKRAVPYGRKIQEVIGDSLREHLPVDDETLVKIAALGAALQQAKFASLDIPTLAEKQAWAVRIEEVTKALIPVLSQQVSLQAD